MVFQPIVLGSIAFGLMVRQNVMALGVYDRDRSPCGGQKAEPNRLSGHYTNPRVMSPVSSFIYAPPLKVPRIP